MNGLLTVGTKLNFVAQTVSLLYRRLAVGWALYTRNGSRISRITRFANGQQVANLRIQQSATLRYAPRYVFPRSPKSAVPMRTIVAPSSMAISKSPDIPMLRCGNGAPSSCSHSVFSSRIPRNNGRKRFGSVV